MKVPLPAAFAFFAVCAVAGNALGQVTANAPASASAGVSVVVKTPSEDEKRAAFLRAIEASQPRVVTTTREVPVAASASVEAAPEQVAPPKKRKSR